MRMILSRFVAGFCGLLSGPALACDLALALALDVSGSIDRSEYQIQRDGLAVALRDPIIVEALVRGKAYLKLVQWTGSSRQHTTIPWTQIRGFTDLEEFADGVAGASRVWQHYSTAVGEALLFTMGDFDVVANCRRKLIDLSGDGPSNEGLEPLEVHRELKRRGIMVNAIAIEASEPELTDYFFENVIHGNDAFVVTAVDFTDYPGKLRKKLLREVTQQTSDAGEGLDVLTPVVETAAPRQKTTADDGADP